MLTTTGDAVKAEQEKLSELERVSQLKEKRIVDEQQKLIEMNLEKNNPTLRK